MDDAMQSVWQPIDTAPRDDTWILATGEKHWPPCAVRYRPMLGLWLDRWGHALKPLHWMPLPEPPPYAVSAKSWWSEKDKDVW